MTSYTGDTLAIEVGRDVVIKIRVTPEESAAWNAAAEREGLSLSEWARRRIAGKVVVQPPAPPAVPAKRPAPKRRRAR